MKKIMCLVIVVLLAAFAVIGCSSSAPAPAPVAEPKNGGAPAAAVSSSSDDVKLGDWSDQHYILLTYYSNDDYMREMWRGFQDVGETFGVKTTHIGGTADDLTQYLNNFEQAINMKPDGIAVLVYDADAYVDVIDKAIAQGIPVIQACTGSPKSQSKYIVKSDNASIARVGAEKLAEAMGGQGDVMVLFHTGINFSEERTAAFKKIIEEEYPGMNVVAELNVALEVTDQTAKSAATLTANPTIKGVYCSLGLQGGAVAQACDELGLTDVNIVGQDLDLKQLEAVRDGKLLGTIKVDSYLEGWWPAFQLVAKRNNLLHGSDISPLIQVAPEFLTKDNVQADIDAVRARQAEEKDVFQ